MTKNKLKGFTLIELLVVIGILAVLLAITLVAINPRKQFQQANDTQRQSDVNAVLSAINQYTVDNQGSLPAGLATQPIDAPYVIATSDGASLIEGGGTAAVPATNLCAVLVPEYIAALPSDPLSTHSGQAITAADCASYNTGYRVQRTANNRITVFAPAVEQSATASATR